MGKAVTVTIVAEYDDFDNDITPSRFRDALFGPEFTRRIEDALLLALTDSHDGKEYFPVPELAIMVRGQL